MSADRIAFLTLRYDPRTLARAVRAMRSTGIALKSKNDAVCKCILAVASQDSGPEMLLEDALSYLHSTFTGYNPCPGGTLRPALLDALREEDATCERTPESPTSEQDAILAAIKRMEEGV